MLPSGTKLKKIPSVGGQQPENGQFYDFDLLCKIIQIMRIDEYSAELRLLDDSNEVWFCQHPYSHMRGLFEGQYVRIRSANLESHHKLDRTFGLKKHSNIMSLPYPCKLATDMKLDDTQKITADLDAKLLKAARVEHPVIATSITDDKLAKKSLVTFDHVNACKGVETYRVRFRLVDATSTTVKGMLKSYDAKSG